MILMQDFQADLLNRFDVFVLAFDVSALAFDIFALACNIFASAVTSNALRNVKYHHI
jgi:hypothetical protein